MLSSEANGLKWRGVSLKSTKEEGSPAQPLSESLLEAIQKHKEHPR